MLEVSLRGKDDSLLKLQYISQKAHINKVHKLDYFSFITKQKQIYNKIFAKASRHWVNS